MPEGVLSPLHVWRHGAVLTERNLMGLMWYEIEMQVKEAFAELLDLNLSTTTLNADISQYKADELGNMLSPIIGL